MGRHRRGRPSPCEEFQHHSSTVPRIQIGTVVVQAHWAGSFAWGNWGTTRSGYDIDIVIVYLAYLKNIEYTKWQEICCILNHIRGQSILLSRTWTFFQTIPKNFSNSLRSKFGVQVSLEFWRETLKQIFLPCIEFSRMSMSDAENEGTLQRSKTKLERRFSRSSSAMSDVSEDGSRKIPRT